MQGGGEAVQSTFGLCKRDLGIKKNHVLAMEGLPKFTSAPYQSCTGHDGVWRGFAFAFGGAFLESGGEGGGRARGTSRFSPSRKRKPFTKNA